MQKGHMVHNDGARTTSNESTGSAVFTFTSGQYTSSVYLSFTTDGNVNLDIRSVFEYQDNEIAEFLNLV